MLKVMKLMMVAVLAVAVMGISAGSAMAWTNAGSYTLDGSLTSEIQVPGVAQPALTCDVSFDTDLDAGSQDLGAVTDGSVTNCTTTIPNCTVTVTLVVGPALGIEWPLVDSDISANGMMQLSFTEFDWAYSGAQCAWNGVSWTLEGNPEVDVTYPATGCSGSDQRTRADFDDAPGLAVSASNALARGTVFRLDGAVDTDCLTNNPEMEQ